MKALTGRAANNEKPARTLCGSPILALSIATCVVVPFILTDGIRMAEWPTVIAGVVVLISMALVWRGFFTLEQNEACVITSWGEYRGTVREPGFYWTNPMARKTRVSLRARSLTVDRLKVHDKHGAPIEMAAVVVWRIVETARASFDVHNATDFVRDQCESAVRHLGSSDAVPAEQTPAVARRSVDQLQETLHRELQDRVIRAGVVIDEVRVTQRCENWLSNRPLEVAAA
jgi:regulator of protease activity HflC (stomatin/prohibitin superfamily)